MISPNEVLKSHNLISCIHECKTEEGTNICIFNFVHKLQNANTLHDIGGTYTDTHPELWFYCSTSECHGKNYLVNLFVLARKPLIFSISLPESYVTKHKDLNSLYLKYNSFQEQTLRSLSEDEHFYLKTYNFTQNDISNCGNASLFIPVRIAIHSSFELSKDVLSTIKHVHNTNGVLRREVDTDFIIISANRTNFPVHKVILAASSSILRDIIKKGDNSLFLDFEDENIEVLLKFLYNGSLELVQDKDCLFVLKLAEKFKLKKLSDLTQTVLSNQITVDNAVTIAELAKVHKLTNLSQKCFTFIKENPDCLKSEAWNNLTDTELVKSLLQFIHLP